MVDWRPGRHLVRGRVQKARVLWGDDWWKLSSFAGPIQFIEASEL
jgi:hypothetical protein